MKTWGMGFRTFVATICWIASYFMTQGAMLLSFEFLWDLFGQRLATPLMGFHWNYGTPLAVFVASFVSVFATEGGWFSASVLDAVVVWNHSAALMAWEGPRLPTWEGDPQHLVNLALTIAGGVLGSHLGVRYSRRKKPKPSHAHSRRTHHKKRP